jgi:hypothetical protein
MRLLAFILLLSAFQPCQAQVVSAYTDNRDYFYAFDNGTYQQLEYLAIKSFRISGNSIAYVDNTNEFKIYYNGQVYKQEIYAADFNYYSTECIVPFKLGRALYVFDRGIRHALTYYAAVFSAGDSIVAFYDDTSPGLKVYYNGEVTEAESSLIQNPRIVQAGSNILAYVDPLEYLKVFYHGNVTTLSESLPVSFKVGGDLVAWEDGYGAGFMVYYRGDTARLEGFAPVSYKTGYGIVAYVDNSESFKILWNGSLAKISSFAPRFYNVKGNTVVYEMNNRFMVFYNGKETELENYVPGEYEVSNDGVAYKDVSGRLKFFWKGNLYTATYDLVTKFTLNGDVLTYETGPNHTRFFFNGKSY